MNLLYSAAPSSGWGSYCRSWEPKDVNNYLHSDIYHLAASESLSDCHWRKAEPQPPLIDWFALDNSLSTCMHVIGWYGYPVTIWLTTCSCQKPSLCLLTIKWRVVSRGDASPAPGWETPEGRVSGSPSGAVLGWGLVLREAYSYTAGVKPEPLCNCKTHTPSTRPVSFSSPHLLPELCVLLEQQVVLLLQLGRLLPEGLHVSGVLPPRGAQVLLYEAGPHGEGLNGLVPTVTGATLQGVHYTTYSI